MRVPEDAAFIKIDIKDYFMSGRVWQLSELAAKVLHPSKKEKFVHLCSAILDNQYVAVDDNTHLKAEFGAGMGMSCSGSISDAAFTMLAEEPFVLKPAVRRRFKVYNFFRFKDDCLAIVGGDVHNRARFVNALRYHSRFYKLVVESVSRTEVVMLDVVITMNANRTLTFAPHVKDTSIAVPLSEKSVHP